MYKLGNPLLTSNALLTPTNLLSSAYLHPVAVSAVEPTEAASSLAPILNLTLRNIT